MVHLGKESLWDSCVNLATFLLESYWNVILKEWNKTVNVMWCAFLLTTVLKNDIIGTIDDIWIQLIDWIIILYQCLISCIWSLCLLYVRECLFFFLKKYKLNVLRGIKWLKWGGDSANMSNVNSWWLGKEYTWILCIMIATVL